MVTDGVSFSTLQLTLRTYNFLSFGAVGKNMYNYVKTLLNFWSLPIHIVVRSSFLHILQPKATYDNILHVETNLTI